MDASNLHNLEKLRRSGNNYNDRAKLALLLDFSPDHKGQDVPDPYYGGADGFAHVWDLISRAMPSVLDSIGP
jgi:protein-tyrosine phosphatase